MTALRSERHNNRSDVARVLGAAVTYFALVFAAGCTLGPVRVLFLEPVFGRLLATLIEGPVLIAAMIIAARSVTDWFRFSGHALELTIVGLVAFAAVMLADLVVGLFAFETSIGDQLLELLAPAGLVYLLLLTIFAAMPLLSDVWQRRQR
jgi:hypothetical protein